MLKSMMAAFIAVGVSAGAAAAADKAALAQEGKSVMMSFGKALKSALLKAVEEDGPANAISVCNVEAPEITTAASTGGWTVARSSHKLRNPANAADDYTAAAIADFLARQAKGEKAADLAKAEIVEADGEKAFRLVKAIPTDALCLACHGGEEVTSDVEARLKDLYPDDAARGFKLGEMRGVFTLTKPLN